MSRMGVFFQDFLNAAGDALGKAVQYAGKETDVSTEDLQADILTAEKLSQLKWMSSQQLRAIYHEGKRKVKIADDPKAYSQLKWFDEAQLHAIFGKEGMDNE